jgi:hypothetical protein
MNSIQKVEQEEARYLENYTNYDIKVKKKDFK